jgi:hypothetical protein
MITSSILNQITFKAIAGSYPNSENILHSNYKHGNRLIIPYCQKFQNNQVLILQFSSDVATVPTLKSYLSDTGGNALETIQGALVSTRGTIDVRYYFNFEVTLDEATYKDKKVFFILTQGSDTLTSEPIYTTNLTDEILKGIIKKIDYSNFDRNNTDISSFFIDWENYGEDVATIFIEATTKDISDSDEIEILEGSQSKDIISSVLYAGINLKTAPIPEYMVRKLEAITSLDYVSINDIRYVKESGASAEPVGNSTSFAFNVDLKQKNAIGINVDNIIISGGETSNEMTYTSKMINKAWAFDIERKAGYSVHYILVKHSAGSSGNDATLICGFSSGSETLIDATAGVIKLSDGIKSFSIHTTDDMTAAGRLYFGVSGVGVQLDVTTQFILD